MSQLIPKLTQTKKHALYIPDGTGHTTIEWDAVTEAEAIVARAKFEEALATSGAAYVIDPNDKSQSTMTTTFDPEEQHTVVMPKIVGG